MAASLHDVAIGRDGDAAVLASAYGGTEDDVAGGGGHCAGATMWRYIAGNRQVRGPTPSPPACQSLISCLEVPCAS